jgi:hypothetical protein
MTHRWRRYDQPDVHVVTPAKAGGRQILRGVYREQSEILRCAQNDSDSAQNDSERGLAQTLQFRSARREERIHGRWSMLSGDDSSR